jgi:hypothetical protein
MFFIAVGIILNEYIKNNHPSNIGAVRFKSRFVPVYKEYAYPELGWRSKTNIAFARNKAGVYQIKEDGKLVYIGASRADVYRKALRHFEPYVGKEGSKQEYYKHIETKAYTIRITLTNTPEQAYLLEAALINKYKPRDNYIQPTIFDNKTRKAEAILTEYEDLSPQHIDVEAPF